VCAMWESAVRQVNYCGDRCTNQCIVLRFFCERIDLAFVAHLQIPVQPMNHMCAFKLVLVARGAFFALASSPKVCTPTDSSES